MEDGSLEAAVICQILTMYLACCKAQIGKLYFGELQFSSQAKTKRQVAQEATVDVSNSLT